MLTSAAAKAAPIRSLTARSVPFIPTPTETAKTSSPSESATNRILKNAATVIASARAPRRRARLRAQNRVQWVGEQLVHRRAQLHQRERLVEKRVGAGRSGPFVHRIVVVAADHDDGQPCGRRVVPDLRDQLDSRDPRQ